MISPHEAKRVKTCMNGVNNDDECIDPVETISNSIPNPSNWWWNSSTMCHKFMSIEHLKTFTAVLNCFLARKKQLPRFLDNSWERILTLLFDATSKQLFTIRCKCWYDFLFIYLSKCLLWRSYEKWRFILCIIWIQSIDLEIIQMPWRKNIDSLYDARFFNKSKYR